MLLDFLIISLKLTFPILADYILHSIHYFFTNIHLINFTSLLALYLTKYLIIDFHIAHPL